MNVSKPLGCSSEVISSSMVDATDRSTLRELGYLLPMCDVFFWSLQSTDTHAGSRNNAWSLQRCRSTYRQYGSTGITDLCKRQGWSCIIIKGMLFTLKETCPVTTSLNRKRCYSCYRPIQWGRINKLTPAQKNAETVLPPETAICEWDNQELILRPATLPSLKLQQEHHRVILQLIYYTLRSFKQTPWNPPLHLSWQQLLIYCHKLLSF